MSIALSVGALYSVLSSGDFRGVSIATAIKLLILFAVGATLKLSGAVASQQNGRLRATAHHDPLSARLWGEVRGRLWALVVLWALLSLFEGIALESFAREIQRFDEPHVQPVWVYALIGGTLAGFGFYAAEAVAFVDGLQELRDRFNQRAFEIAPPSNPNLSRVLREGALLLSVKERIDQESAHLKSLVAEEEEPPQATQRTQKLLDEAIAQEEAEAEQLTGLVGKYADVFTPLPHQVIPEEIIAPKPPKKVTKKLYYLLWFFRRRGKDSDKSDDS